MAEDRAARRSTSRMHERDNVAIVANDGGLPAGTVFPSGLTLRDNVPQGHKVALVDIAEGGAVRRYNVADRLCAEGHPRRQLGARAAAEDARRARARRPADRHRQAARRSRRWRATPSRATATPTARSARATSWPSRRPCSAWPASPTSRCSASRPSCCRGIPNVDDVVALEHSYGCGVAIDAPDADHPDPHAAQHQPQPQLRRRGDGGQPGLREAAARAPAAAGHHPARSTSATWPTSATRREPSSTWSACRTTRTSASCRWSIRSCARPRSTWSA